MNYHGISHVKKKQISCRCAGNAKQTIDQNECRQACNMQQKYNLFKAAISGARILQLRDTQERIKNTWLFINHNYVIQPSKFLESLEDPS
jgi:hypothetical protein